MTDKIETVFAGYEHGLRYLTVQELLDMVHQGRMSKEERISLKGKGVVFITDEKTGERVALPGSPLPSLPPRPQMQRYSDEKFDFDVIYQQILQVFAKFPRFDFLHGRKPFVPKLQLVENKEGMEAQIPLSLHPEKTKVHIYNPAKTGGYKISTYDTKISSWLLLSVFKMDRLFGTENYEVMDFLMRNCYYGAQGPEGQLIRLTDVLTVADEVANRVNPPKNSFNRDFSKLKEFDKAPRVEKGEKKGSMPDLVWQHLWKDAYALSGGYTELKNLGFYYNPVTSFMITQSRPLEVASTAQMVGDRMLKRILDNNNVDPKVYMNKFLFSEFYGTQQTLTEEEIQAFQPLVDEPEKYYSITNPCALRINLKSSAGPNFESKKHEDVLPDELAAASEFFFNVVKLSSGTLASSSYVFKQVLENVNVADFKPKAEVYIKDGKVRNIVSGNYYPEIQFQFLTQALKRGAPNFLISPKHSNTMFGCPFVLGGVHNIITLAQRNKEGAVLHFCDNLYYIRGDRVWSIDGVKAEGSIQYEFIRAMCMAIMMTAAGVGRNVEIEGTKLLKQYKFRSAIPPGDEKFPPEFKTEESVKSVISVGEMGKAWVNYGVFIQPEMMCNRNITLGDSFFRLPFLASGDVSTALSNDVRTGYFIKQMNESRTTKEQFEQLEKDPDGFVKDAFTLTNYKISVEANNVQLKSGVCAIDFLGHSVLGIKLPEGMFYLPVLSYERCLRMLMFVTLKKDDELYNVYKRFLIVKVCYLCGGHAYRDLSDACVQLANKFMEETNMIDVNLTGKVEHKMPQELGLDGFSDDSTLESILDNAISQPMDLHVAYRTMGFGEGFVCEGVYVCAKYLFKLFQFVFYSDMNVRDSQFDRSVTREALTIRALLKIYAEKQELEHLRLASKIYFTMLGLNTESMVHTKSLADRLAPILNEIGNYLPVRFTNKDAVHEKESALVKTGKLVDMPEKLNSLTRALPMTVAAKFAKFLTRIEEKEELDVPADVLPLTFVLKSLFSFMDCPWYEYFLVGVTKKVIDVLYERDLATARKDIQDEIDGLEHEISLLKAKIKKKTLPLPKQNVAGKKGTKGYQEEIKQQKVEHDMKEIQPLREEIARNEELKKSAQTRLGSVTASYDKPELTHALLFTVHQSLLTNTLQIFREGSNFGSGFISGGQLQADYLKHVVFKEFNEDNRHKVFAQCKRRLRELYKTILDRDTKDLSYFEDGEEWVQEHGRVLEHVMSAAGK